MTTLTQVEKLLADSGPWLRSEYQPIAEALLEAVRLMKEEIRSHGHEPLCPCGTCQFIRGFESRT